MTSLKPRLVYHADWGSKASKRWCAKALLGADGRYTAFAPRLVGDPTLLLTNLRSEAGVDGIVLAGFDFPIGLPSNFAKGTGISNFRELLPKLGQGVWKDFYSVCDSAEQISVHRPFYPNRSRKGCKQKHLFDAHSVEGLHTLLRRCERGSDHQKQACCLFWTLGPNQVGKAALIGWRDVIAPALRNRDEVRLWPFDGSLEILLEPGNTVVAETYPAECYSWFPGDRFGSKMEIESRRVFGTRLLAWARDGEVMIEPDLENAIKAGFPDGGDDAFDAVVGLLGMLQIALGQRSTGDSDDEAIRGVEGWILGRRERLA